MVEDGAERRRAPRASAHRESERLERHCSSEEDEPPTRAASVLHPGRRGRADGTVEDGECRDDTDRNGDRAGPKRRKGT
jgi:hypothetical protein